MYMFHLSELLTLGNQKHDFTLLLYKKQRIKASPKITRRDSTDRTLLPLNPPIWVEPSISAGDV